MEPEVHIRKPGLSGLVEKAYDSLETAQNQKIHWQVIYKIDDELEVRFPAHCARDITTTLRKIDNELSRFRP